MYVTDRAVTDKVIESRIAESPSDYLAYCSNCRDFFAEKGKTSHHILDLIFEGCTVGAAPRSGPTLSQRRSNRRNLAAKLLVELWGSPCPNQKRTVLSSYAYRRMWPTGWRGISSLLRMSRGRSITRRAQETDSKSPEKDDLWRTTGRRWSHTG